MKRTVVLITAFLMVVSMAMPALAANDSPGHSSGGPGVQTQDLVVKGDDIIPDVVVKINSPKDPFAVSMPSSNSTAKIEIAEYNDQIKAFLVVTQLPFKPTIISAESRAEVDIAYDDIINREGYNSLRDRLIAMSKTGTIGDKYVIANTIFDVTYYEESWGTHVLHESDNHGTVTIEVPAEVLEHYVALLHYYNGRWNIVESARILNETQLEFSVSEFSPFAIVVDGNAPGVGYTDKATQSPKTGNSGFPWFAFAGMMVAVICAGFCISGVITRRKDS